MRFAAAYACAITVLGLLLPGTAPAQTYPSRTVTVVVPFPPGGSVDGVARILVQKLNETMGQHFIVENRASGASGIVGANAVAKASPDGYTLLLSASVHVINPFLYKSVPYDVVTDFTPVMLLADGPLIVSTTPSVPVNNLKDFFDLVRREPQKFTFGATTIGSASHLTIELLKRDAGINTLVVTYKGTAPALTDLMSGQIQLLADPMLSSLPLAQGGKIKALGVHEPQAHCRSSRNPDGCRIGRQRLCLRVMVRIVGTKKPGAGCLQQTAICDFQGAVFTGGQAALEPTRLRTDRRSLGSVRKLYSRRDGKSRKNHRGRQNQGRLIGKAA